MQPLLLLLAEAEAILQSMSVLQLLRQVAGAVAYAAQMASQVALAAALEIVHPPLALERRGKGMAAALAQAADQVQAVVVVRVQEEAMHLGLLAALVA